MSTASPETWADVSAVATHRAASCSEPYVETASRRSCSWYAGERQPLLTSNSTPSSAASVAASAQRVQQIGVEVGDARDLASKTVVPSGTTPSAAASAPRRGRGSDR